MIKAELDHQLMIQVADSVGSLAEVTAVIASSGINMVALCAYSSSETVSIMFVTEDNNAAEAVLTDKGFDVEREEVILLTLSNRPGALQDVTEALSEEGIDLHLMYGSVDKDTQDSPIVLISDNNLDAMMLIKSQLERG